MNGPEEGAQSREERVESWYQESAWVLAERIVYLEDTTAELRAELATSKRDADAGWEHAQKADDQAAEWATSWKFMFHDRAQLLRYRSAWLSARRRAARESEFAAEALALKDAEITRLTADVTRAEA